MESPLSTLAPSLDSGRPAELPVQTSRKKRILKLMGRIALGLAVLLFVAHLAWGAWGSNEWKLVRDVDGAKLWTLKTPGEHLLRVKASVTVKSSLAGMVKLLEDLDSCVDAYCYDTWRIQQIPSQPGRAATYVRFKFDIPGLKTREYVAFAEHYQDPATRQLDINVIAAPSGMPRDTCCVRVTHLHNHWKLTPLPGGKVAIEFAQDTDLGGMPYPLANIALAEGTFKLMGDLQGLMDKPRYRDAKVPDIQELGS